MKRMLFLGNEPIANSTIGKLSACFDIYRKDGPILWTNSDVEVLWIDLSVSVDSSLLNNYHNLEIIVICATGHTNIDMLEISKRDIKLLSLKNHQFFLKLISSSAEHAWALLLAGNAQITEAHAHVKAGLWDRTHFKKMQLKDKTLGLIGFGRIGRKLAIYGNAFDMKVLGFDPYLKSKESDLVTCLTSQEEVLANSDFLIISASAQTRPSVILGPEQISMLKVNAGLVNIARGSLVDELEIYNALKNNAISFYATDVLAEEDFKHLDLARNSARELLISSGKALITPHIGGYSSDAREMCEEHLLEVLLKGSCNCGI